MIYTFAVCKSLSALDDVLILRNAEVKDWFFLRVTMFDEDIKYKLAKCKLNSKLNLETIVCVLKGNGAVGLYCPVVDSEEKVIGYCMTEINTKKNINEIELLDWLSDNSKLKIRFLPRILNVNIIFDAKISEFIFNNSFSDYAGIEKCPSYCCIVEKITKPGFYGVRHLEIHKIERQGKKVTILKTIF
jgi:hypothetical protein